MVKPIPVNNPIIKPFSFPFIPATNPPINNVMKPMINDMYETEISVIFKKRIISAKTNEASSKMIIITIHPYNTAEKNERCKLSLLKNSIFIYGLIITIN